MSSSTLFAVNVDEWLQSASADNGDCEDIADDQGNCSLVVLTSSAVKLCGFICLMFLCISPFVWSDRTNCETQSSHLVVCIRISLQL